MSASTALLNSGWRMKNLQSTTSRQLSNRALKLLCQARKSRHTKRAI